MTQLPATGPTAPTPGEVIELLPSSGAPIQLMILLHGVGSSAAHLRPLGDLLRRRFPTCAVLIPDGFEPFDGAPVARQWFSVRGVTEENRPERIAAALPGLIDWIRAAQNRLGVEPAATALFGFSQGAILALEAVQVVDGLAGRVLAFSGRYGRLPQVVPQLTTLHLMHGEADPVIPVAHARAALERLDALGADASVDLAEGIGHELHPVLIDCALHRLTSHIPQRTWRAALGAAQTEAAPRSADASD